MTNSLKPCRCGSPMTLWEYGNEATATVAKFEVMHDWAYRAECKPADVVHFFATREEAIAAWNRRSDDVKEEEAELTDSLACPANPWEPEE